jgi:hypothetical protein
MIVEVLNQEEIDRRFGDVLISPEVESKLTKMRQIYKKMANIIEQHCPDSRGKSLALTHLEQSMMWANASISRNE